MGPTASGKTGAALYLAQHLPCEIISVDSALVYRGMDIGTAKPSPAEQAQVRHWLIDIRDAAEPYSAAEFRRDALQAMADITARGKIPLLVGGTMLYFKALLHGLAAMPVSTPEVRAELEAEATRVGWPAMHAKLAEVDPITAAQLHPNHSQRICRALEVFRLSGIPMSAFRAQQKVDVLPYRTLQLALAPKQRALLNQRIAMRFQHMMSAGFLEETYQLFQRQDLHMELPAMRAVGYRQAWEYWQSQQLPLSERLTREQLVERATIATRQLAKRQLTWLRSWPDLVWIDSDEGSDPVVGAKCLRAVEAFLHIPGLGSSPDFGSLPE